MFSGIVQAVSKKANLKKRIMDISYPSPFLLISQKIKEGDSVAVNGVCLTVVDFKKDLIEFDVVHESIKLTNISEKFSSYHLT